MHSHHLPRISGRIAELKSKGRCSTPFCGRPTMAAAGQGLAQFHCKRCIQHKARHGSTWAGTLSAKTLTPYARVAAKWVEAHKADSGVAYALLGLRGLLDSSGSVEPAMDIKRRSSRAKARIAFARLREGGIQPERMLAVQIGVAACIEDDGYAPKDGEYLRVQAAKALHRLASGTHREWGHVYPRSSGGVLRVMGREVYELCGGAAERAMPAVQAEKLAVYGPHESKLPGYSPPWQLARKKAQRQPMRAA
jgi:hypothetical protein